MTNNQIASFLMIILGIMITILLVLVTVYIVIRLKSKQKDKVEVNESKPSNKTKVQQLYNVQSVFNFMEFDKIEDNMIVQKDGKRFLMVVKCQGINYDLMSAVEKNSVEQGFIQYLNTLRNIQRLSMDNGTRPKNLFDTKLSPSDRLVFHRIVKKTNMHNINIKLY